MSISKKANAFIGKHATWVARFVVTFYIGIWFLGGLVLVDVLDPFLFIGLWMPVGFLGALICYRW